MSTDIASSSAGHYSLLPLRDVVVFPHMVIPLFVGRAKSIKALEVSMEEGRKVLLLAQKNPATDDPTIRELHGVGTIASILQLLKLPDGTVKVLVEGVDRALVTSLHEGEHFWEAEATALPDESKVVTPQIEALKRTLLNEFEQFLKLNKRMNPEIFSSFSNIQEPGRLADSIAAQLPLKLDQKQEILDLGDVQDRCEQLLVYLQGEIDVLQVEKRIRGRVKRQMEKSQREYYLNEQVKAIQKEL
ncbi:MAG: endopeptidase La, partial [Ferrovum sp.]|nr:endopeptidase La [Ferrovum sp.]